MDRSIWKFIAGILISILITMITTYASVRKDVVVKEDFKALVTIVEKNTEDLNRLIGYLDAQKEKR